MPLQIDSPSSAGKRGRLPVSNRACSRARVPRCIYLYYSERLVEAERLKAEEERKEEARRSVVVFASKRKVDRLV